MADSGYKNISRIDVDSKNTHGWYVRIFHKGVSHAKFFSDSVYDGEELALREALEHRNELEKKLGKPRTERYVISAPHPNNNTGIPGVIRKKTKQKKRGKWYSWDIYEVTWNPVPGRVSRTSVSIQKHGEEEAFRRAVAIRKQKLSEIVRATREPDDLHPNIKWIFHHDARILRVDYHDVALKDMAPISDRVTTMVNKWPVKVKLLYNLEGIERANEVLDYLNQVGKEILPNTEKVAILGLSGFRAQLLKAYALFNRHSFTLFDDEKKALDWLTE